MEPAQIFTTPTFVPPAAGMNEILSQIRQIREVFEKHFDRSWLGVIIDELPIDSRVIRDIREFLAINEH